MQRKRFTTEGIRLFSCPADTKQAFMWDTEAPRLAVRVTAGQKSFIFESKLNRQTIRRTIGNVKAWTIDDARAEARRLQTQVDQGIDPRELERQKVEEKAAAKLAVEAAEVAAQLALEVAKADAENRQRYTLHALCDAYADFLKANGKIKSAAATRSIFKCHVIEAHPHIAALPASDVTSLQIAAMVRKVREAGKERAAGILRSYLSAAFNAAKKSPFDASLPADMIPFAIAHNPVDAIPAIAVKKGQRTLSAEELRAYIAALGTDLADQALKLALFSGGQRMAQLLRTRVSDFDDEAETLLLWDGKGKRKTPREHLLPLAPKAAELVAELVERAKSKESSWLFSTHGRVAMTFTTPGKRVTEICAAMGGEAFDLRDIRRTVETMLAGMGLSRDTRAQLLSHGLSGVQSAHYDRHSYMDEKRAALLAWESRLEEIESGLKLTNIVHLKRKSNTAA